MLLSKPWSASMLAFSQVRCSAARDGVTSRRVGKLAGEGHGGEKNQGPTVGAEVDLQSGAAVTAGPASAAIKQ